MQCSGQLRESEKEELAVKRVGQKMSDERSRNNNMDLSAIGDNLPVAANAVGVVSYDSPIPNIVVTSSNAVNSTNWSSSRVEIQ